MKQPSQGGFGGRSKRPPPADGGGWSAWDEILRLHGARGRRRSRMRAAIVASGAPEWLAHLEGDGEQTVTLDTLVSLGLEEEGTPKRSSRVRAGRRGSTAVALLAALVDLLVEAPDTQILVIAPSARAPDGRIERAIQRAFVATEEEPMAVVMVGDRRPSPAPAWIVPTGKGVVRPAVLVGAPRDRLAPGRLTARGALRDTGVIVAHGRALLALFARHHPLLVRMFTYAAELPLPMREPYLDAACRGLAAPPWPSGIISNHHALRVVAATREARWSGAMPAGEEQDEASDA